MTTVQNSDEARSLAAKIVESKLAACVQILPQMISVYVWEGVVQTETECLLLIKTIDEKWDELSEFITKNHSYAVPEIVAIDVAKVSEPYLAWMKGVVGGDRDHGSENIA